MADRLTEVALNEVRALQREIQGLKNRLRDVESKLAAPFFREPEAYPRHVPGTTGRGIQYELSDGTRINAGKVKALAAEAALHAA